MFDLEASHSKEELRQLQTQVGLLRSQAAYRTLFMRFAVSATRFAAGIVKSEETAEEIYCDVMMKIWDMEEDLLGVENYRLYLFRAMKNTALNYLRKQNKKIISLDQLPFYANTSAQNADAPTLAHDFLQQTETIVATLSPQCQAVYRLIKEEGLSYKEAANVLDISVNTIEFHMKGALAKLRAGLEGYIIVARKKS